MKLKHFLPVLLLALTAGGNAQKQTAAKGASFHISDPADVREPFFRITGTERFWTIEMTGTEIKFISLNKGESFNAPFVKPVESPDGKSITYKSFAGKKKDTSIEITAYAQGCNDGMGENPYTHVVRVTIIRPKTAAPTVLKGCANFVADTRLNKVWILQQLKGINVTPQDFGNELPYIDLHIAAPDAFTGFAGCNLIKGNFHASGADGLKFTDLASGRMTCTSGNKEPFFLDALRSVIRYEITENRMLVFGKSGLLAVFKPGT